MHPFQVEEERMSENSEMGVMGYKGGRQRGWEREPRRDPGCGEMPREGRRRLWKRKIVVRNEQERKYDPYCVFLA